MYNYPDDKQLELIFTYKNNNNKLFTQTTEWRSNYERHKLYDRFLAYTSWLDININLYTFKQNVKQLESLKNNIEKSYSRSPLQFNKPILLNYSYTPDSSRVWLALDKYPTWSNYFLQISASSHKNRDFTFYHELSHILLHQLQQNTILDLPLLTTTTPLELKYNIELLFAESFSDIWAIIMLRMHGRVELTEYISNIIDRRDADIESAIEKLKYYLSLNWTSPFGHDTREALYYLYELNELIVENLQNIKFLNELALHLAYIGTLRTIKRLVEHYDGFKLYNHIDTNLLNDSLVIPHFKFKQTEIELIELKTTNNITKMMTRLKQLLIQGLPNKPEPIQKTLF